MPVCDICNKEMNWSDGYVLTTTLVTTTEAYWKYTFTHQWSYVHNMDPTGESLPMLVKQQAGQTSGWLTCQSCSQLFTFDRAAAKSYAQQQNAHPPGSGAANIQQVASVAANVWKQLYGASPSGIQMVKKPSTPTVNTPIPPKGESSDCFVATVAFGASSPELSILRAYRDRVLLQTGWGRMFISFYYKLGPYCAKLIGSSLITKSVTRHLLVPVMKWCEDKLRN